MGFSFKAMWNYKCPRCHQGKIFREPFIFSDPLSMYPNCAQCNQATEPEPGFYFGAMFISYILSTFFLLTPALILVFAFKWSVGAAMTFIIFLGLVSFLKFLRGSRSLWFHLMVKHKPEIEAAVKQKMNVNKTT